MKKANQKNRTPQHLITCVNRVFKLLILFTIMATLKATAQFADASATEYIAGVSAITARYTGNDVLQHGADVYKVSCWDQSTAAVGMSWRAYFGGNNYSGTNTFTSSGTLSPSDVCLVIYSNDVYAIATYHNTNYYCEVFKWNISTFVFNSISNVSFSSGSYWNTLHIDADANGNFAIVYDQLSSGTYIVTGAVTGLNNSGSPLPLHGYYYPDVAVYNNGSKEYVHVSSVDAFNTLDLFVDDYKFADLATGTVAATSTWNTSPTYSFDYPRIACPNGSNNSDYRDWTVVVVDFDAGGAPDYYIEGFNNTAGTVTGPIDYNAGLNSPGIPLETEPNSFPVVTYDSNYPLSNGIWVGWTFDAKGYGTYVIPNPTAAAVYPIVLKCDNAGVPVSGTTFWEVPNPGNLVTSDSVAFLSLSGRHVSDSVFLTYNVYVLNNSAVHDIYTKEIEASSATSLKVVANEAFTNLPTSRGFELNTETNLLLYNLHGEMVLQLNAKYVTILDQLKKNHFYLPVGLYFARFNAFNEAMNFTEKIFIGN